MAAENVLAVGKWSRHRQVTGAPVVPDAAPDGTFPNRRALLNTFGYETILVYVRLTGGAVPTVDIQPLLYDEEQDTPPSGNAFPTHVNSGAVGNLAVFEVATYGHRVFLRIAAVNNNPTAVEIRVAPGNRSEKVNE